MSSVICTLFEGDYHLGLGAFVNSLFAQGYRGAILAGYRGPLPPWAKDLQQKDGYSEFKVAEGLCIRFFALETTVHLTNYKPDFMLQVWEKYCPEAESLFYFDPDITIKCRWSYFEEWIQGGVALCEDINSPVPTSHPLRNAWRAYYQKFGRKLANAQDIYVNGGFVGVSRERKAFLNEWQAVQREMAPAAGNFKGWGLGDRTFAFFNTDQDALNITLMDTSLPVSLSGKDGMDLIVGGYIMSHALGPRKPWRRRYLWERFSKGISAEFVDKAYWSNVKYPIAVYSPVRRMLARIDLYGTAAFDRIF